ncbi:MAG: hypothetical protein J4478_02580 [Candidatus Diapherotrites archaeon]|uniref:Uncharacterized protein n=1 Tax=Candidatus Iainarchaeum sp. TaxID=3101447 RepID=A0A7J4KU62_9ARCH|nr:hypothetical protein [Candidatus Diapherotrites archaeon]HIH33472.1 hypothetical protein [Candidatus Diapherotrites archaeon]
MDRKNFLKNIVKMSAIVLGVFILSQAVSAKYFSLSIGYCDYCVEDYYNGTIYSAPTYSYSTPAYATAYYSPGAYYSPAYYSYSAPVISYYDYYYPPLTTWGNYYADALGGYSYGAYYNSFSPYQTSYAPAGYYSRYYPSYAIYN